MRGEAAGADALTRILIHEVLDHVTLPRWRWLYRALSAPLWRPLHRFSELVLGFEERAAAHGFRTANEWFLPWLAESLTIDGQANVPADGPVLIASNHPGTVDALAIAAAVPRDDLRILSSRIPFLTRLPATSEHLLFTSPDRNDRRAAMWAAIRHLDAGGAVLMFPRGGLDPDPDCMPGAEVGLTDCFDTVETILRRASDAALVLAIVGGVLLPEFVRHPLTRVRRRPRDRQRIAEYVQVIRQMRSRGELRVQPRVSFAPATTITELNGASRPAGTTAHITRRARLLLSAHLEREGRENPGRVRVVFERPEDAPPTPASRPG
jgi:hypothetical protein